MSKWNSTKPTVHHFDGRVYTLTDHVAQNWMQSGVAASHIKYCYCALAQGSDERRRQYDAFWNEWVTIQEH